MDIAFRCSLSVINFKDKIKKVWGLREWIGADDPAEYVLFFGLYTQHDYDAWWYLPENKKRMVFWCGSDILNTLDNPEFQRRLKLFPKAKHFCETEAEAENLRKMGIKPKVVPSFLEDEDSFPLTYKHSETPHIWMCAHPQREREYGVDIILRMAKKFPDYKFHIYGIYDWKEEEKPDNVIYHGQVSNERFNMEIRNYQCGFRGNLHDGLSEVPVKAVLMGQYAITRMKFPWFWHFETEEELEKLLAKLKDMKDWNRKGRKALKGQLNNFPWCRENLVEAIKTLWREG